MMIFRLPFQQEIFTVNADETDASAVSFFSFDQKRSVHFPGKMVPLQNTESVNTFFPLKAFDHSAPFETEEEYLQNISRIIEWIRENRLKKLVIARKKFTEISAPDIWKTFQNLCRKFPSAFVYAFMDNGDCWAGAFSELLGKYSKKSGEFSTMSLAGTLPVEEAWTEKEICEQQPVTDYILDILHQFNPEVEVSPTYDHISGNIKHLRNDFRMKLNRDQLDTVISALHPTPAVCGIPKDFCRKTILDFEQFDREYYAGYSRTETEDDIFYFVNLRCGKLYRNAAVLFAGGGITPMSNPQKEWRETELKADALLKSIL